MDGASQIEKMTTDNPGPTTTEGWNEWGRYVLFELKRIGTCYSNLDAKVEDIRTTKIDKLIEDVATLRVKSGVWGILGGAIPVVLTLSIYLIYKLCTL